MSGNDRKKTTYLNDLTFWYFKPNKCKQVA